MTSQNAEWRRREFSVALAALALAAVGCGSGSGGAAAPPGSSSGVLSVRLASLTERNRDPSADGVAVDGVAKGFNQFAIDSYLAAAASAAPSENVLLGSYSLATALALTMAGTAGDTRSKLASLLHVPDVDSTTLDSAANALDLILESRTGDGVDLHTANRIFVRPGLPLVPEFLDTATGSYGASVAEADFAGSGDLVADAVNEWVADQTDGFIDELVESFNPTTVIALVNAVFLKAEWGVMFRDIGTVDFQPHDGDMVAVPAFGHDDYLPQHSGGDFSAVEMPYKGGNLSMVVVMPNNIEDFESSLDLERLDFIIDGLREEGIHYALPKWAFEQSTDALALLEPLGLPVGEADFSAMFEGGQTGYFIDQIDHKARIQADETGTTAAAATEVAIAGSHGPTVTINRPFFYLIRDRGSKTILFVGRVMNPLAE